MRVTFRRRPEQGVSARRRLTRCTFVAVATAFVLLADPPGSWAVATVPQVINNLRNWVVGILAGLATLFLTFGGLRYLMAGGDPGEVESSKRALKAAAIGYGLAILAPVVVTILKGIVGAGGGQ
ncbi:pilin [Streptomyces sp. NBC_00006]|uniref:pilin n=1 Tax=unclassified Streptomyces TaxID=2593676 RepID=UPI002252F15C|nr:MULTISPECIES: pilin [unclassified Streptomyces]MCX5535769.1 pilin [Streptomyces sp. NBC_00006]